MFFCRICTRCTSFFLFTELESCCLFARYACSILIAKPRTVFFLCCYKRCISNAGDLSALIIIFDAWHALSCCSKKESCIQIESFINFSHRLVCYHSSVFSVEYFLNTCISNQKVHLECAGNVGRPKQVFTCFPVFVFICKLKSTAIHLCLYTSCAMLLVSFSRHLLKHAEPQELVRWVYCVHIHATADSLAISFTIPTITAVYCHEGHTVPPLYTRMHFAIM